jgi:monovalent cation:H+ antiporter-2, CPA2 family
MIDVLTLAAQVATTQGAEGGHGHAVHFIQDLAVIMLVAGFVTVIFHQFRQPVVLGYIVAGFIIGPHTPPFSLVKDPVTVQNLSELGVIFLMFSLGLEFSLRKLMKVGSTAFVAAIAEILLMFWVGYEIGRFFDWGVINCIFLGTMLSMSSTTIIIKALNELGLKNERFAQLVFGILIVEDLLGIVMIALLSSLATTGTITVSDASSVIGKLTLFMAVSLVVGFLTVPRLVSYVAGFKRDEMLLVSVLGLCFGYCMLVVQMQYSVALGAFVIGAIIAESKDIKKVEHLVEPLRDMFSAVFFVSIGMLIEPAMLREHVIPILVITVCVVCFKIIPCTLGAIVTGNSPRESLRVGMTLAQIGEFSFIIATLGLTLKNPADPTKPLMAPFLYPIAVAVSALTTLFTPYLIKGSDPLATKMGKRMPQWMLNFFALYTHMASRFTLKGERAAIVGIFRQLLWKTGLNILAVIAIFLGFGFLANLPESAVPQFLSESSLYKKTVLWNTLLWMGAVLLSLPFLIVSFQKIRVASRLMVEVTLMHGRNTELVKSVGGVVVHVIPLASLLGFGLMLLLLSSAILPNKGVLIVLLALFVVIAFFFRNAFMKVHGRLQHALIDVMNTHAEEDDGKGGNKEEVKGH